MTTKKLCNRRFHEIEDVFDWKVIPNHSSYVINQYGDIYNKISGQCIRTHMQHLTNRMVKILNDSAKPSSVSCKKQIRDLFGIGYIRQDEILSEKYATYLLSESYKGNV